MPDDSVTLDKQNFLFQCNCNKEKTLIKAVFVSLNFINKKISKKRKTERKESSEWKAMRRLKKQHQLKVLKILRLSINDFLKLINLL